ncbi:HEAT repeat-containing protein [Carboxydocella sporoproducens DSM 16521]|uniref:HEAT repeat-containing protein n=2 Tax=Carboxydocella TaxID=178898 RepID=A0A1T4SFD2_9FIRM|nr:MULTISPECIES: HEAT repeat domain-containing protein [Carboxydocella]AVX19451.1 HEAT repeat-containing protein [Carboxydocella thermautotrophica]AVX29868.1 HEAT repeat-containing protein [Carboxydocella thermautotrophica]SKA27050.1 HEAT repeat-containing protein [Carboxydocella sporoproducens DSM 16521]
MNFQQTLQQLIEGTSKADFAAAEKLLELTAILGEFKCRSWQIHQALDQFAEDPDLAREFSRRLILAGSIPKTRWWAKRIKHLRRQGDQLVAQVVAEEAASWLGHPEWPVRQGAVELLAVGCSIRGEWLQQALRDFRVYVRGMVYRIICFALANPDVQKVEGLSRTQLIEMVEQGLADPSPYVREKAAYCLSYLPEVDSIELLQPLLYQTEQPSRVRLAILNALMENLGEEEQRHLLWSLRRDQRLVMRLAIREMDCQLSRLDLEEDEPLLAWGQYYSPWDSGNKEALDRWLAMLLQSEPAGQKEIIGLLKRAWQFHWLTDWLDFLKEASDKQLQIPVDLWELVGEEAVPALLEILRKEKDVQLRQIAMAILGRLGCYDELERHLLETRNPPDWEGVLEQLAREGNPIRLNNIRPLLTSFAPRVILAATRYLLAIDSQQLSQWLKAELLQQLLQNVAEGKIYGKNWGDLARLLAALACKWQVDLRLLLPGSEQDNILLQQFILEVYTHRS